MASRMLIPTTMPFHHLKKFLGYLNKTMDYCLVVTFPQAGEGYVEKSEHYWRPEAFSGSDLGGNKGHRRSTSGGFHALNGCRLFNSCRTRQIVSLSSREAELRGIVPSASDGIYAGSVLEFAFGTKVGHYIFTDSSSACQLVTKRGVGKVRN